MLIENFSLSHVPSYHNGCNVSSLSLHQQWSKQREGKEDQKALREIMIKNVFEIFASTKAKVRRKFILKVKVEKKIYTTACLCKLSFEYSHN